MPKYSFLSLTLLILIPRIALGGAWVLPEKSFFTINTLTFTSTVSGSFATVATPYHKTELINLLEYGLTPTITLGTKMISQQLSLDGRAASHNTGIANEELYLRYHFLNFYGAVVSLQPLISLPSAYSVSSKPLLSLDEPALEMRLLAGYSTNIAGYPGFINAETALRGYTESTYQEAHADFAIGVDVTSSWRIIAENFNTIPLGKQENLLLNQGYPVIPESHKFQLSALYGFANETFIQTGFQYQLPEGTALATQGIFVGLWKRF